MTVGPGIWLAVLTFVGAAASQPVEPARFDKAKVKPNVVSQGEKLAVSIPFASAPGWRWRAYRVIAYRPYAPTACLTAKRWPLTKSKHGRDWDSFGIRKWTWLGARQAPPSALNISLDTTGWPPGDYRLQVVFLFRADSTTQGKPKAKRDRYVGRHIHLSVLPRSTGKR